MVSTANELLELYRDLVEKESSIEAIGKALEKRVPEILAKNNIEYCDTGRPTFVIKNGVISTNSSVPKHFSSPLGFGNYLDAKILQAIEDIGKIGKRASLNHTIVLENTGVLPKIAASLNQLQAKPGGYDFGKRGDESPIPQKEGKILLTQLSNMYLAAGGGTSTITAMDQPTQTPVLNEASEATLGEDTKSIGDHAQRHLSGINAEHKVKKAVEVCADGMKGVSLTQEEAPLSTTPPSPSRANSTRESDIGGRAR